MNQDLQLKLQAYADGELSGREAQRVADWIEGNSEAQALLTEVRLTKSLLREAELERPVPESRDFYWSKIRRGIEQSERIETKLEGGILEGWRRFLVPLAGTALVLMLGLGLVKFYQPTDQATYLSHLVEIESPSEHIGSYSFRSQSGNMYVVWLYDRNNDGVTSPEYPEDL